MQPYAVALLLNDIHIGRETIEDFKLNWKEAMDVAIAHQVSRIIVGGDLFLSRSSQNLDILLAVYDVMQECEDNNISVTLLEGNHDLVDQESERGYCHVFSAFDNVVAVDSVSYLKLGDVVLGLISYFPEKGSFVEKLALLDELIQETKGKQKLLYIHQGIQGALTQPTEQELPAKLFAGWDKVLVGHYHDRTQFDNIEYIGASRQHNFGEDEEKGYTLLYSDGSTQFIKNRVNVRYKTVETDFENYQRKPASLKNEIEQYVSEKEVPYRVRVRIHCDPEQVKRIDKIPLIEAGASKVEIAQADAGQTGSSQQDFEKKLDKGDLKELYKVYCKEYNKTQEEYDLGIKYLKEIK